MYSNVDAIIPIKSELTDYLERVRKKNYAKHKKITKDIQINIGDNNHYIVRNYTKRQNRRCDDNQNPGQK